MSRFFRSELDKALDKYSGFNCEECEKPLSIRVYQFCKDNIGRLLCWEDQKKLIKEAPTKEDWKELDKDIAREQRAEL